MKTSFDPDSRQNFARSLWNAVCVLIMMAGFATNSASAQLIRAPLTDGFARTSSIDMTVDEMLGPQKPRKASEPILGPGYPSLWTAEIQYKPIRHRLMPVTDPKTGQVNDELVWYFVYRIIPRDYTELAGENRDDLRAKLENAELKPSNNVDQQLVAPLMLPRFVLRGDDDVQPVNYVDEVNLEIQRAVFQREFGEDSANLNLLNSVTGVQEIPPPVSALDPLVDPLKNALYGVAIWRNVDPDTDYFTVFMSGFSNAYRIDRPDADLIVERKVVEQRFGRPGDRYRQQESEFRFIDNARIRPNGSLEVTMEGVLSTFSEGRKAPAFVDRLKDELENSATGEVSWPRWIYQKRPATLTVPHLEPVLRHAATTGTAAAQNGSSE